MTNSCLKDVQCKGCHRKGHLRIECPSQELFSPEQRKLTSNEGMDGKLTSSVPLGDFEGRGIKRKSNAEEMSEDVCEVSSPDPVVSLKIKNSPDNESIEETGMRSPGGDLYSDDHKYFRNNIKNEDGEAFSVTPDVSNAVGWEPNASILTSDDIKDEYSEDHIISDSKKFEYSEDHNITYNSMKGEYCEDHIPSDSKKGEYSENPITSVPKIQIDSDDEGNSSGSDCNFQPKGLETIDIDHVPQRPWRERQFSSLSGIERAKLNNIPSAERKRILAQYEKKKTSLKDRNQLAKENLFYTSPRGAKSVQQQQGSRARNSTTGSDASEIEGSFQTTILASDSIKGEYWEDHITSDSKKGDYSENPVTSEPILDKVTSSSPIKWTPTVTSSGTKPTSSTFWKIGKPNRNEDTVVCPSGKCGTVSIKYSKIASHLHRIHQGIRKNNILCPFCKGIVFPKNVPKHLPNCSAATPLGKPLESVLPKTGSSLLREDFLDIPLLPGLSVIPINSDDGLDFFAAKLFVESYLIKNFKECEWSESGIMNCSWMYMNYMEANKIQGRVEVLSPTKFLILVNELSSAHWKIDVGPFSSEKSITFESLYFKGFLLRSV